MIPWSEALDRTARWIQAWAFCCLVGVLPGALAAAPSFDCSKANSYAETTICRSHVLAGLDEQLAHAYQAALSAGGDSAALRQDQANWLRRIRNECRNESCLEAAYTERLRTLGAGRQEQWSVFRDAGLGLAFSYPSAMEPVQGCHASRNCVALVSGKSKLPDAYAVALEVFDGNLETVAARNAVFVRNSNGWTAKGRFGERKAERLTAADWTGLKSVVDCGVSDSAGFHAAGGECLWAVLSDGRRSVVIDTQGTVPADGEWMRLIESVRLGP